MSQDKLREADNKAIVISKSFEHDINQQMCALFSASAHWFSVSHTTISAAAGTVVWLNCDCYKSFTCNGIGLVSSITDVHVALFLTSALCFCSQHFNNFTIIVFHITMNAATGRQNGL